MIKRRPSRRLRLGWLVLAAAGLAVSGPALARAAQPVRSVRYLGYLLHVPRSWPVYDLRRNPTVCVRFDRHALYLGAPSADQRCPAHAAGRTEAILVQPLKGERQGAESGGEMLSLPRQRLLVTATWDKDPSLVRRALGLHSLRGFHAPRLPRATTRSARAHPAQVAGGVYTGLGFDACSAPSTSAMSAWGTSPYRAVGVYIGGANRGCSQPNLTSSWVSAQAAAGWHLIPIYVGLQAPSNSCGCQAITASQAHAQGIAAANDAVLGAASLGIEAGSPIYFDMEAYTRGGSNTSAVLAFLSAWTAQLHANSYTSGVYSSAASGIRDLVAQFGTGYLEPDDIWIADWNGQQSTSDPYVPRADWSSHQRLHQYKGGHNETHGGVALNIDNDYLDGATAGAGGTGLLPRFWLFTAVGNVYGSMGAQWFGSLRQRRARGPAVGIAATPDGGGYWLAGASGQVWSFGDAARLGWHGHSQPVAGIAADPKGGYWLFSASGSVWGSGARWFGSPSGRRARRPGVVGMAASADGGGYWVVGSSGQVWSFGDAPRLGWHRHSQPIAGVAADPKGGYWLFTASGNVYASDAGWFGSPSQRGARRVRVVGMAATPDGAGYWLVGSSGQLWSFGDAPHFPWKHHATAIAGIASS